MKSLRVTKNQIKNQLPMEQGPLVSSLDNSLQLDNTLKLLKNYMKKQILSYSFSKRKVHPLRVINSDLNKFYLRDMYKNCKIQLSLLKQFTKHIHVN